MRVGLRGLDLDRVAPGRLLFHHRPHRPGPLPLLLLKAEPGTPSQGFFSASSSFLATSSPSLWGRGPSQSGRPCASRGRDPTAESPGVIGGPQSSVAPGVPRERAWGCGLTARLPVAGSLCCGSAEAYSLSVVSARTHFLPAATGFSVSSASSGNWGRTGLRDSPAPGPWGRCPGARGHLPGARRDGTSAIPAGRSRE